MNWMKVRNFTVTQNFVSPCKHYEIANPRSAFTTLQYTRKQSYLNKMFRSDMTSEIQKKSTFYQSKLEWIDLKPKAKSVQNCRHFSAKWPRQDYQISGAQWFVGEICSQWRKKIQNDKFLINSLCHHYHWKVTNTIDTRYHIFLSLDPYSV